MSNDTNLIETLYGNIDDGSKWGLVRNLFQALQNEKKPEVGTINLGTEPKEQALPFAKQCWMNLRIADESTALRNINVVHTVQDRTFIRENISEITNARLSSLFSENEIAELFLFWLQCASCFHCEIPWMIAGVIRKGWKEPSHDANNFQTLNKVAGWCVGDGKGFSHIRSMVGMISWLAIDNDTVEMAAFLKTNYPDLYSLWVAEMPRRFKVSPSTSFHNES